MSDSNSSNPKDAISSTKAPLELVPDTATFYMSLAFLEGALKYGRYSWRVTGASVSVYRAAGDRHRKKYWNGEWADPKTRVPHLASSMACDAIILDAAVCGKLIDDRPPSVEFNRLVDEAEAHVAHLMEMFKDHHPYQYTIADTPSSTRPAQRTPAELPAQSPVGMIKKADERFRARVGAYGTEDWVEGKDVNG